jgi:hypothetical protein
VRAVADRAGGVDAGPLAGDTGLAGERDGAVVLGAGRDLLRLDGVRAERPGDGDLGVLAALGAEALDLLAVAGVSLAPLPASISVQASGGAAALARARCRAWAAARWSPWAASHLRQPA